MVCLSLSFPFLLGMFFTVRKIGTCHEVTDFKSWFFRAFLIFKTFTQTLNAKSKQVQDSAKVKGKSLLTRTMQTTSTTPPLPILSLREKDVLSYPQFSHYFYRFSRNPDSSSGRALWSLWIPVCRLLCAPNKLSLALV